MIFRKYFGAESLSRGLLCCPYMKCKTTTDDMASTIWTIVMVVLGIIVLIILLRVLFGLI